MSEAPTAAVPPLASEAVLERLRERFGAKVIGAGAHAGQHYAVVERGDLLAALEFLRRDPGLRLEFLSDLTAVDHLFLELPQLRERYAVVYSLTSLERGTSFRLKVPVPEDDPRLPSASGLWPAALWGERECHDMFGIVFEGNPDLRRLLMPADYDGFPLRKDYPLRGRGERDGFPKIRRFEGEEPKPASAPQEPDAETEHS